MTIGTIGLPLIFSINKAVNINWYFDTAFAVHKDMRSHTGGFMIMGIGGACIHSIKQNLKTKRLTEAKFVGVDDLLT